MSKSKHIEFFRQLNVVGVALAITISWSIHHSILWAIFEGFLSWLYVIYYAIKHT